MSWETIYAGIAVPALLFAFCFALACYDRWERRHPRS